jgi:hypothetical protein
MPVPHSTDKFDAETLPDPELNPLLNPLLAAHMGRWAEVYFTNPPEKRGQAVSELLRELENTSLSEPASIRVSSDDRRKMETKAREAPEPSFAEPVCACNACAHDNPVGQKFCGMCGSPLQLSPEVPLLQVAETVPIAEASWSEPELSLGGDSVDYSVETSAGSAAGGSRDARHAVWPLSETDLPHFAVESESVPYRYRLYVGVVMAILLAVLVYMGWRGRVALSGDGSQPASARAMPAAPPVPAASAQQPNAAENALPTKSTPASPLRSQTQPELSSRKDETANARPAPWIVPVATNSSAIAAEQSGVEELATAERYMTGNRGMARDSGEAAQWLWKAVGKGNLAATMALSDLYLRGDGVPKSCDQARVLLDAAARKGGTAAAGRLRNLQAFGCE